MLGTSGIEKRYARALERLCKKDVSVGRKRLNTLEVVSSLFDLGDAKKVLNSPVMPLNLKLDLLNYALKKAASDDLVERFIKNIADAGRIPLIPGITTAFKQILDEKENLVLTKVTSAYELSEAQKQKISTTISGGKQVSLVCEVDPNILGGLIVRVGNSVLDMSLKTKLNSIAKSAMG